MIIISFFSPPLSLSLSLPPETIDDRKRKLWIDVWLSVCSSNCSCVIGSKVQYKATVFIRYRCCFRWFCRVSWCQWMITAYTKSRGSRKTHRDRRLVHLFKRERVSESLPRAILRLLCVRARGRLSTTLYRRRPSNIMVVFVQADK